MVDERAEHSISESSLSNFMKPPLFSLTPTPCPFASFHMSPSFMSPYWIILCLKSRPYENHPSNHYATIKNKTLPKGPAAGWRRLQVENSSTVPCLPIPKDLVQVKLKLALLAILKQRELPKTRCKDKILNCRESSNKYIHALRNK